MAGLRKSDGAVLSEADRKEQGNTLRDTMRNQNKRRRMQKNKNSHTDTVSKERKNSKLNSSDSKTVSDSLEDEGSFNFSKMQIAVMGVLLTVYVATMHPSLPGGDAGELIVAASELGVAHPPGYPLYTVTMKAFFMGVPYGSVAWRANLLTAIMAAAAGSLLYQAVFLLSKSVAAGLLAAGMFSFSRLTWAWSVTAEVFALNNLLVAILLVVAIRFSQSSSQNSARVSQLGAFMCGLCLSNQHTTIIYIAVVIPWVLYTLYTQKVLSIGLMVRLSVCFGLGLLPYIYLPLSSVYGSARWTWGDQSTLSGFLTHLFRREYGTMHLLKDHEGQGFIAGLIAYMEHVAKDLTPAILFFFSATVFCLYKRWYEGRSEMILVMLLMLTTYAIFFAWRANLDIDKPLFKGVVERFWLQSDLILVTMAAVAFSDVNCIVNRLVPVLRYHMDKIMAVALVAMQITLNIGVCNQSNNRVVEDFALTTLKAFPQGALVLTKGDLPSNSLRYYHLVESVRPDLTLFDQEVLTYEWSIPMLGHHVPGMVWPGGRLHLHSGVNSQGVMQFTFRQLLDAHYDRKPIFGCIGGQEHEPSWESSYYLRPFGICMQFIKKGSSSSIKLAEWLKLSRQFANNWSHPVPLSEYTWEDVASGEMWKAKTVAGLYLLESVDSLKSTKEKASRLRQAYNIYKEAIESHLHFPGYWHKNFALVCEKLRHVADSSETIPLIKTTIAHFKAYLHSGTSDPQTGTIKSAIKKLQEYVDYMTQSRDDGNR